MLRLISALTLCIVTACGGQPTTRSVIAAPGAVQLETGETYALVTLDKPSVSMPQLGLCRLDGAGRYQIESLANLATCTSPGRGLIIAPISVFRNKPTPVYRLKDGTRFVIAEVRKRASIGWSDPDPGKYAIVGRRLGASKFEALGPDVFSVEIARGALHYLGSVTSNGDLVWSDQSDLAARILAEFPKLGDRQLISRQPSLHSVKCSRPGTGSIVSNPQRYRELACTIEPAT